MEIYTEITQTCMESKLKFEHSIYPNWIFAKFGCRFDPNLVFTLRKIYSQISQRFGETDISCYSIRNNKRSENNQRTITLMIHETSALKQLVFSPYLPFLVSSIFSLSKQDVLKCSETCDNLRRAKNAVDHGYRCAKLNNINNIYS